LRETGVQRRQFLHILDAEVRLGALARLFQQRLGGGDVQVGEFFGGAEDSVRKRVHGVDLALLEFSDLSGGNEHGFAP